MAVSENEFDCGPERRKFPACAITHVFIFLFILRIRYNTVN